jgi:hypothetical protein
MNEMAFIRVKKINKAPYAYLVECISTKKGPRQKVKGYLGRVYEFERQHKVPVSLNAKNTHDLLLHLAVAQLKSIGFTERKSDYYYGELVFSSKLLSLTKRSNNKPSILRLNDGFLCGFTLDRILKFKKTKNLNKDANILAKYFLAAGIPISEDQFVAFYQLL